MLAQVSSTPIPLLDNHRTAVIIITLVESALLLLLALSTQAVRAAGKRIGYGDRVLSLLLEFTRIWYLSLIVVCLRAGAQLFGISLMQDDKATSTPFLQHLAVYFYHGLALAVCAQTNVYLRRGTLYLTSPKTSDFYLLKEPLSHRAISSSAIFGLLALIMSFLLEGLPGKTALLLVYVPATVVSVGLVGWLGIQFYRNQAPIWTTVAVWTFAGAQLAYPYQLLWPSPILQTFFVGTICALGLGTVFAARSMDQTEIGNDHITHTVLARIAAYEGSLRELRKVGRIILAALLLSSALCICSALSYLAGPPLLVWHKWAGIVFFALVGIALITALQWIGYKVRLEYAPEMKWQDHDVEAGNLYDRLGPKAVDSVWSIETFCAKEVASGRRAARVAVLLHGFGSSGRRCWGLLPAILIHSGKIDKVCMLSYTHSLYSEATRLEALPSELANRLAELSEGDTEEVTVYAHSLGGLLAIRAFAYIHESVEQGSNEFAAVAAALKHLVCIGVPIYGSPLAVLGIPWVWPCRMLPLAGHIRQTLAAYRQVFPWSEYAYRGWRWEPTCVLLYGARDKLLGKLVHIVGHPHHRQIPGEHSTASGIFDIESHYARVLIEEFGERRLAQGYFESLALAVGIGGKRVHGFVGKVDGEGEKRVVFVRSIMQGEGGIVHVDDGMECLKRMHQVTGERARWAEVQASVVGVLDDPRKCVLRCVRWSYSCSLYIVKRGSPIALIVVEDQEVNRLEAAGP